MAAKTKFELKMGSATREAFGKTLVQLGKENKNVVVCDADLSKSTMVHWFAQEFPDRFFTCGIAEANMVAIGAGLASSGKIPFVASFSAFVMTKGFEQLRVTVAYPNVNVKVVGTATTDAGAAKISEALAAFAGAVLVWAHAFGG